MKSIAPALIALLLAAPAFADTAPAPAEKTTYICYYSAAGKLTSSKPAEGEIRLNQFFTTGRSGDQAWAYGVKSTDGSDCPKRVRN